MELFTCALTERFPRELIPEILQSRHREQPGVAVPTEVQENMAMWFPHFVVNIVP
jgi:hypothetical protein